MLSFSHSPALETLTVIYSHPQALGQCQQWLETQLPGVTLIASNSTSEAVCQVQQDKSAGAIAAPRAAKLYDVPILAEGIQDYPENCNPFLDFGINPSQYRRSPLASL